MITSKVNFECTCNIIHTLSKLPTFLYQVRHLYMYMYLNNVFAKAITDMAGMVLGGIVGLYFRSLNVMYTFTYACITS